MKPRLVSGIQPSGRLHLGNYLGALKNFVALQNSGEYECFFFVADLHSMTEDFEPKKKFSEILDVAASFVAAGLNPKKSVIFQQSRIPAHAELGWILNTITPMGELSRMTQFKDKSEGQESVNVGLFAYPTLMAGDILLYDAKFVPVGEDQLQHLELARTLARKFNSRFGETFAEPKALLTETPRIMSLSEPEKKMSKSSPAGCLYLDDSEEETSRKIMSATTDSGSDIKYDAEKKPGISNLMRIYASLSDLLLPDIEKKFEGKNYSEFKKELAELVNSHFSEFRMQKAELMSSKRKVEKILAAGSKKADKLASRKMEEIKEKVGLI